MEGGEGLYFILDSLCFFFFLINFISRLKTLFRGLKLFENIFQHRNSIEFQNITQTVEKMFEIRTKKKFIR